MVQSITFLPEAGVHAAFMGNEGSGYVRGEPSDNVQGNSALKTMTSALFSFLLLGRTEKQ